MTVHSRISLVATVLLLALASLPAAAQCPREAGWWGYSAVRSMVIDDDGTALLTSGELLLTASVVDPSQPAILGEVRVGDGARALAVAGGVGWVATAAGELVLVDVHDPSTPRLAGRLDASARAVAPLSGDLAAMVVGDTLWMVDAADTAIPRRLATVPLTGTGRALVTLGTLVVAADGHGLILVDASDPGAPIVVSTLALEDSGAHLAAAGDRVFVAAIRPGRLHVVDVADPTSPRRLHSVAIPPQPGGIAFAEPATVAILNHGEDVDEVLTLNVAGDDPPRLAGRLAPGGQLSALAVLGSTAWVARVVSGASAIETSPPETPRVVGELTLPAAMVSPTAVGFAGGNVLVLSSHPGRLNVVDSGAAPHPGELASLDLPGDAALGLAITGSLALTSFGTCDWGEYGLECVDVGLAVVDVADPTRPTIVSLVGMASSCLSDLIAASESLALVGGAGLQVVDLGDPAAPELVATIGHGARHVALDGRLGVYSTSSEELCILGLDDPAAPIEHGCHSLPGTIEGLALEGSLAAILVSHPSQPPPGEPELLLFDLSSPASPAQLAAFETWDVRGPIAMDGGTVLVDAGDRWLAVDLTDPAAPQLRGFSRPATTRALALSGASAAVAFEDGIALYDLSTCGASPPLADFGWTPALPALGETVRFVDRSGGPPTGWSWDFGDGSIASGAGPSHAFQGPGPFRVEVTAGNDHGTSTAVHEVPVYSLGMPTPSSTVIPAAAHLDGVGDTRWRSDLVLATANVAGRAIDALLFFLPRGDDNTLARGVRVTAPTVRRLADVVAGALGAGDEAGAILIASERPLVVSSRTFTDGPDGSYGQAVPTVRPADVLAYGEAASLLLLEETNDFRSNVGAVNLTGDPVELELALLDRDGRPLGVVRRTLPPFGSLQENRVLRLVSQAPVEQARAEVRVLEPGARIGAYASVVDNATGDPAFVTPARPSAEPLYLPAVAHAPGRNGTLWRSRLEICAVGATTVRAELFADSVAPGAAPPAVELDLAAGRCLRTDDAVWALFRRAAVGGLRLTPLTGAITAASRTFTDGPEGTYGQLIPAVPASAVPSTWTVVGLRESADPTRGFRSNLGMLNLEERTVDLWMQVYDAGGARLLERPLQLGPLEHRQLDRLLAGLGGVDLARAEVFPARISDPVKVLVYASVVDNATGDPALIQGW